MVSLVPLGHKDPLVKLDRLELQGNQDSPDRVANREAREPQELPALQAHRDKRETQG